MDASQSREAGVVMSVGGEGNGLKVDGEIKSRFRTYKGEANLVRFRV